MRKLVVDQITQRILTLCAKSAGMGLGSLVVELALKTNVIHNRLARLEKRGFLCKEAKKYDAYYTTTRAGFDLLAASSKRVFGATVGYNHVYFPKSAVYPSIPQNTTPKRHYIALLYPLKDPIPEPDLRVVLQQLGIASKQDGLGQFHFTYHLSAELHSKHLILFSPKKVYPAGTPSMVMDDEAIRLMNKEALELEAKFSAIYPFKLLRIDKDTLLSKVIHEEIAHEKHPLAEAAPQKKLVLLHSDIDGKERVVIDASKIRTGGFKELETVHKVTASQDSDMIDEQFKGVEATEQDWGDLVAGRLKLGNVKYIPDLFELTKANALQLNEQVTFFKRHNQMILEVTKLVRELTIELRQRRLP